MKPSLQLRLSQQLKMTPQLQQAIALLQMSSQELETRLIEALQSNPLLEPIETEAVAAPEPPPEAIYSDYQAKPPERPANGNAAEHDAQENWSDHIRSTPGRAAAQRNQNGADRENNEIPDLDSGDLKEHLLWQLNLSHCSPTDVRIGVALIDAINEHGYLTESLEDIRDIVDNEQEVGLDEVTAVLHKIQHFDPIGIGARDLCECLNIQLDLIAEDCETHRHAREIVNHALPLLAKQDIPGLKQATGASEEQLREAIDLIRSLEPRPGSRISAQPTEYVRPDVLIEKIEGRWQARLHGDMRPQLKINGFYADLIGDASKSDASYLRGHLQEARWLLKSLETRNDTVLKVASAIVERQYGFFEHGPEAMQPLVLREVADMIDMHESTVSRVTNGKYMLTPRGVFEFKYFFSSHVGTSDGEGASSTAIQSMIAKLIEDEPAQKPLSDSKIATLLNKRGIDVARRTVAKYREGMNIPSSSKRKRLI